MELNTVTLCMFLIVFFSVVFFDSLDFHVGRNQIIKFVNFTKSIYVTVLTSKGSVTYFVVLLLDVKV